MSGRTIRLDDRSWEDLREELVRRIPVHAPEWTDHNPGDPGIALLELFAWLGTNLLYRMNRVPEKAYAEYLNLLNIDRLPAAEARALVQLMTPSGALEPVLVPFGSAAPTTVVSAPGGIDFEVEDEIVVLPVEAQAFVKAPVADLPDETTGFEGVDQLLRDHFAVEPSGGGEAALPVQPYEPRRLPDPEGGIEPPAVGLAETIDRSLWIALLADRDMFERSADKPALLRDVKRAIAGRPVSFGFRSDDDLCGPTDHLQCPDQGEASPRDPLTWEISTGRYRHPDLPRIDEILYRRLSVISDTTATLARSGVVRLMLPRLFEDGGEGFGHWAGDDIDPDLLGIGELPPRIDDAKDASRVLAWIRVSRREPDAPLPRLHHVGVNIVGVRQSVQASGELLGFGDGGSRQRFRLARQPVIPESVLVQVRTRGTWVDWVRVDHLGRSNANDRHYLLDDGHIVFGDGINGRLPQPGEAVRCLSYRTGGGAAGNVPALAITKVAGAGAVGGMKARNLFAAVGGRDAESDLEVARRAPQVLKHNHRAVARDDFRDLVGEAFKGTIGRVEVLARHMPHERVDGVPGVVTLVIVPAYDPIRPDTPTPDRTLLDAVCSFLESRRVLTTELYVTPPEYVPVWASAAYEVEAGYGIDTVNRWVELAVRQFLAPLPPYGPAGGGWPIGRTVRAGDVEAAILRVEGVRLVHDVRLEGEQIDRRGVRRPATGSVSVQSWQLPDLRRLQIVAGETAEPIEKDDPIAGGGPDDGPAVPVPVLREEC